MAFVRKKGNQVAIVRGERDPKTGKVSQRTLFTFWSKVEAQRAIGKGQKDESAAFQRYLEDEYPGVKFNWPKIRKGILEQIEVLPDNARSQEERLKENFLDAMRAFAREIVLADPLTNPTLAEMVRQKRKQLEFLEDVFRIRLEQSENLDNLRLWQNDFFLGRSLRASDVSPDVEEFAADLYRRKAFDGATAAFELLTECFPKYAEGHNYLGLIALDQGDLDKASQRFRLTVELGRKSFPSRLSKKHFWNDLSTRPYMRGLRNLALTLIRQGIYQEALSICDVLEKECGDDVSAACFRASVHLNRGEWKSAEKHARVNEKIIPFEAVVAAFAQFEQGNRGQAVCHFLFGALNHPLGIQALLTNSTTKPRSLLESEDYNGGLETRQVLSGYLKSRSSESKRFFSSLMTNKRVSALMREALECSDMHSRLTGKEHRENFDRWHKLRSFEFAEHLASTLDG
jgi:tetratricopeptide (TPR) repeat protein